MKKNKRAAIVFYEGYISVQPSVVNAAKAFARRGYEVDLFYRRPLIAVPAASGLAGVRLRECRPAEFAFVSVLLNWFRILRNIGRRAPLPVASLQTENDSVPSGSPRSRTFKEWLGSLGPFSDLLQFAVFCWLRIPKVDVVVCFDMTGLAVTRLAKSRKTPVVYWSLEPMLQLEVRGQYDAVLKRHEIAWLPQVRNIVVQSPERGQLLATDIAIQPEKFVIVPNGPAGSGQSSVKRTFFNERFPIAPSATIVLSAGAIQSNVGSLEFAEAARDWDEEFVLVMHERAKRSPEDPFLRQVQEAGGERVVLSLDPVPLDQVDEVYAGAQIGLIYYQPINVNYATGAHASGKLAYYLQYGLPIIVLGAGCPQFILDYGCGIAVERPAQIKEALATIVASYGKFSAQARQCYRDLFDVDSALNRLIDRVEEYKQ
jgi:glycosyltransferase involved in cell wall biosynthesis